MPRRKQLVICVRNEGAEDLELRKVYEFIPDSSAAKSDYVRVVDESGEDYLYSAEYFLPIQVTSPKPFSLDQLLSPVKGRRGSKSNKRQTRPKPSIVKTPGSKSTAT